MTHPTDRAEAMREACVAACPYDAIFINPADGCAEKCNFCAHRLEIGLEPSPLMLTVRRSDSGRFDTS